MTVRIQDIDLAGFWFFIVFLTISGGVYEGFILLTSQCTELFLVSFPAVEQLCVLVCFTDVLAVCSTLRCSKRALLL